MSSAAAAAHKYPLDSRSIYFPSSQTRVSTFTTKSRRFFIISSLTTSILIGTTAAARIVIIATATTICLRAFPSFFPSNKWSNPFPFFGTSPIIRTIKITGGRIKPSTIIGEYTDRFSSTKTNLRSINFAIICKSQFIINFKSNDPTPLAIPRLGTYGTIHQSIHIYRNSNQLHFSRYLIIVEYRIFQKGLIISSDALDISHLVKTCGSKGIDLAKARIIILSNACSLHLDQQHSISNLESRDIIDPDT